MRHQLPDWSLAVEDAQGSHSSAVAVVDVHHQQPRAQLASMPLRAAIPPALTP